MEIVLGISPVLLFLIFLFLLDSFKLVIHKYLFFSITWGMASAALAYFLNSFVLEQTEIEFSVFSQYVAPATEEILKSVFIFFLIYKKRIGFLIDAAIYGFAIGAGFALIENIFYFQNNHEHNILIWIIRGFGTAFMHGGSTSLLSIILIGGKSRNRHQVFTISTAFFSAYFIHSLFNHFYINPVFQTIGILIILPVIFILIFKHNEKQLQNWLEIEFNSEIELLNMIRKGRFSSTRAGEYLASMKSKFSGEVILDMYCYISLYLELSIKAKRNVLLKESGFPVIIEEDTKDKLTELKQLRKQIGTVGELTLAPLIRMNYRNLWQLNTLQ